VGPLRTNGRLKPPHLICGLFARGTGTPMYGETSPTCTTCTSQLLRLCCCQYANGTWTRARRVSCRAGRQRRKKVTNITTTDWRGKAQRSAAAGRKPAAATKAKKRLYATYIFFMSLSQSYCREHRGVGDSGPESPTLRTYLFHYSFRLDNEIEI